MYDVYAWTKCKGTDYLQLFKMKGNYKGHRAQLQCIGKLRISAFQPTIGELCNSNSISLIVNNV